MSIAGRKALLASLMAVNCMAVLVNLNFLMTLSSFAIIGGCIHAMRIPSWMKVAYWKHGNSKAKDAWMNRVIRYLAATFTAFLLMIILPHKMVSNLNAGDTGSAMATVVFLLALLIVLGDVMRRSDYRLEEFNRSVA